MSFQRHKGRIFILSECQCPVREISVFVPSSGGFRKYAILMQGGRNVLSAICGFDLSRSLSEGRSYCMRTVEVQAYDDVLPSIWYFVFVGENVPNREKTSREDTFVSHFQAVFQPMYRGCRNDVRRKKVFLQPSDFSFGWDWNAFGLKNGGKTGWNT